MPSPNRILIALFALIAIVDVTLTVVEGLSYLDLLLSIAIAYVPLLLALSGRGGKIIYFMSLLVSWLLGLFVLIAVLGLVMLATGEYHSEIYEIVLWLIIGALGIGSYYCITRTHPLGRKTEQQKARRQLNNGLIFSLGFIFVSNIALIVFSGYANWTFVEVMWVYWIQSIVIGLFAARSMLDLKQFDRSDFKANGVEEKTDKELQVFAARGFLFHYGGFHLFYLLFIVMVTPTPSLINILYILILSAFYFGSHLYEYRSVREELKDQCPNLDKMFSRPYVRIIPMHITVILGLGFMQGHGMGTLILFITVKAILDAVLEINEYRQRQKELEEQSVLG